MPSTGSVHEVVHSLRGNTLRAGFIMCAVHVKSLEVLFECGVILFFDTVTALDHWAMVALYLTQQLLCMMMDSLGRQLIHLAPGPCWHLLNTGSGDLVSNRALGFSVASFLAISFSIFNRLLRQLMHLPLSLWLHLAVKYFFSI